MSKTISGIATWLKNWFYDKSDIDGFVTTLNNNIGTKLNANLTTANKNLVTNGSGQVVLEDKPNLATKNVTVVEQSTAESGFAKTYVVKQNGVQVGSKINIPKDFLVKSASVQQAQTPN